VTVDGARNADASSHTVDLRAVQQLGDPQKLDAQAIGDQAPLVAGRHEPLPGQGCLDRGEDHLAQALVGVGTQFAPEEHLAAPPIGGEHLRSRGFELLVRIGDRLLHTAQPGHSALGSAARARCSFVSNRNDDAEPKQLCGVQRTGKPLLLNLKHVMAFLALDTGHG